MPWTGSASADPQLRLVFAGVSRSEPAVGETAMARRARRSPTTSDSPGMHVFFDEWMVFDERPDFLLDADIGRQHATSTTSRPGSRSARASWTTSGPDSRW